MVVGQGGRFKEAKVCDRQIKHSQIHCCISATVRHQHPIGETRLVKRPACVHRFTFS